MGIAQEIADLGPVIAVTDVQRDYVHAADSVFDREKNSSFIPIRDEKIRWVRLEESRAFLKELGIDGELLHTPGHSDDSISLSMDEGSMFVGDLNPLYELELHKGTQIGESWKKLLARKPHTIYYGHARTWRAEENPDFYEDDNGRSGTSISDNTSVGSSTQKDGSYSSTQKETAHSNSELYALVSQIMKLIDKGVSLERIRKKTGADPVFIEDVARMYLTHQNVGVQGILDRIEIKGK